MKRLVWNDLNAAERVEALARPAQRRDPRVLEAVRRIFDEVEAEGEAALRRWSLRLDQRAPELLALDVRTVDGARAALSAEDLEALDVAVSNVRRYHEATRPGPADVEIGPGIVCRRLWRPIASCGLYIPGGTAPLFSTLIMLAEPARVAGVPMRISVTPPQVERGLHPMMIAAAAACGLDTLWLIGGAQAIAALTFGVVTPRAQKLFGPGNAYVSEAKRYAAGLPGGPQIDLPAGPSELMVIADERADPAIVAADLLSQAEHDADAQVILASNSVTLLDDVVRELALQLPLLPRSAIASAALNNARAILVQDIDVAVDIANQYAPEHLSLQTVNADGLVRDIDTAGAVFIGRWSAETFGDYITGPSHVLPTDGAGRVWSGVSVSSFMRSFSVQEQTEEGARVLAGPAARLARLEGLEAHARAAEIRARR